LFASDEGGICVVVVIRQNAGRSAKVSFAPRRPDGGENSPASTRAALVTVAFGRGSAASRWHGSACCADTVNRISPTTIEPAATATPSCRNAMTLLLTRQLSDQGFHGPSDAFGWSGVALVPWGKLPGVDDLAHAQSVIEPVDDDVAKVASEVRIRRQILPGLERAVAGDDRVDVLDAGSGLGECRRIAQSAAAIEGVDNGRFGRSEQVARVDDAGGWKHDPGIAARMTGPEVVQVDAIFAGAERHLVLEHQLGQEVDLFAPERIQLVHGQPRVLVCDDFHCRTEGLVAADMVAVRMRVDDGRDRLVRDRFDLRDERLPPSWKLGVYDDDTQVGHEDGRVPASARREIQVVL